MQYYSADSWGRLCDKRMLLLYCFTFILLIYYIIYYYLLFLFIYFFLFIFTYLFYFLANKICMYVRWEELNTNKINMK